MTANYAVTALMRPMKKPSEKARTWRWAILSGMDWDGRTDGRRNGTGVRHTPFEVSKITERALQVRFEDVLAYEPTPLAIGVGRAIMAGTLKTPAIARLCSVPELRISQLKKDPVFCAWLSLRMSEDAKMRVGFVDNAVLAAAMAGNVQAARLYYDRHHPMVKAVAHAHVHTSDTDYSRMSDEELQRLLAAEAARPDSPVVIDVEAVGDGTDGTDR